MTADEVLGLWHTNRSKANAERLAQIMVNEFDDWETLLLIVAKKPHSKTWVDYWLLSHCALLKPVALVPYAAQILHEAKSPLDGSCERELWRALSLLQYGDGALAAPMFDGALSVITNQAKAIAVRYYAMDVAAWVAKSHPDLQPELIAAVALIQPVTPSLRARIRQVERRLSRP